MPIAIGTQLGSHEITALLGKGGMGEVYRARDLKLKREVAIKILPEEFSRDADRVRRFQREAEILASLNHPNIAAIYDFEETSRTRYLVLELVEGETLADRIARGPVPVDEALDIAKEIAEALEAAHERGIIHRDLKPANVKLTPEGKVKVLDFGLAKVLDEEPFFAQLQDSPTLTIGATRVDAILGTAAYMSPEQAIGKPADRRSDVWSFGAVLYEMLTGTTAFTEDSARETLAAVVKLEPDWEKVPASTPAPVRKLLRRCLTKDRTQRLQAMGEARIALENPAAEWRMSDEPSVQNAGLPDATLPARREWLDATLRLATSWVGLFVAYAAALAVLLIKFKELKQGLQNVGLPPWLALVLIAAFPVLAFVSSTIPALIEQRRIERYSKIRGSLQPGYFTLHPRQT